jgi:DNA adenine methylase
MLKIKESPIFYMGNKYKLLKQLIPLFPEQCNTFLDLFGGSAVVSMNYKGKNKTIYNEFNKNIVELVKLFKYSNIEDLDTYFNDKIKEFNIISTGKDFRKNMELQKGYYDFRNYYNGCLNKDYRDLYLLICYSMNHLIRFNKNNEFNASCGSTQRYIKEKIENGNKMLQDVDILNKNCFEIDFGILNENDFVYCDPPYLNTEAVYNEKRAFGGWNIEDDYKLFSILEELNDRKIKWGLSNVFVNRDKENTHLIEWCNKNNWNIVHLNRNYNPFSRGNSNNDEVYICNYLVEKVED